MSDNDTTAPGAPAVDPVQQLLQSNNGGQPMSAEQRNDRREALLKRQRESREKAQQMSAAARANAAPASAPTTTVTPTTTTPTSTLTTAPAAPAPAPVAAPSVVVDAPVRENMVQQAVSFLSSPSVQLAEESKKTAFLEKKGLTLKEIELARARVAGTAAAPAPVSTAPVASNSQQQQPQAQAAYQAAEAPPPVPPRTYAPAQGYPIQQQQPMYIPQQQQQQVVVDPNAFKKKVVLALLISGGVTALTSVIVQKLVYPMVRGITGARQSLVVSQTEILSKLKEKLLGYKEYLVGLHLGSNRAPVVKAIEDSKDASEIIADKDGNSTTSKKTTIEDVDEDGTPKAIIKTTTTTTTTTKPTTASGAPYISTAKQLDVFSQKLESHSNQLNFEQLKATRAVAQDLAEYITKETYALSTSIAYPTSRYYGYNTGAAAASGKAGGLADPTTPESALKSEIRSLKGLLLNWRNFPVAKDGSAGAGGLSSPALPNLVQQH